MRFTLLIFVCILSTANAQMFNFNCEITEQSNYNSLLGSTCNPYNSCNPFDNNVSKFIPSSNSEIKIVRLRFVIFHYSSVEPRNFQKSNPLHVQLFMDIVNDLNYRYSHLNSSSNNNCTYEAYSNCTTQGSLNINGHTKIQFSLSQNDIIEIVDSFIWNADNFSSCGSAHTAATNAFAGDNSAINVYFIQSECNYRKIVLGENNGCTAPTWVANGTACANFPSNTLSFVSGTLNGGDSFSRYKGMNNGYFCSTIPACCPLECPYSWQIDAKGLAHEIGHNLGLGHANDCPESMMNQTWNGSRDFLFNNQIGKMHKSLGFSNVRYSIVGCFFDPYTNYVVDTDEIWNNDMEIYQHIIVKAGSTLTITCKLGLSENAKIIVEQNARLIIDGGYLTSSVGCKNAFWQGIEVWGNSAQHQYTYGSNQLYQGFVELKNGAVIENANTAIWLGKADDWQMLNTGGIVQAYGNSVFRNNKRDVAFLKYQNFNPSNPAQKRGNLSYFRNCKFETTASLNDGSLPTHHVTMWNVDGVRFYGCTFENSNPNATTLAQLGNGIYTEDAHFVVTGCDWNVPCIYMQCCSPAPNIFKHLNYGIRTKQVSGTQYNYNVDNNTFDNCFVNVYNEGVNNAIITRNNHTIGKPRFGSIYGAGVEFNTGSGYRIEENNFTGDPNPNVWFSVGTWITNTGMNNNQVYKNTFSNLNLGNYAYQRNRGYDGTSGLYSGLAFLCNTHTAISWYDIYVYGSDPLNDGIRQYQGKLNLANNDVTASAGNTFSHTGTNADSDISNTNTPNFTYFYDGMPLLTNPKYPYYVTPNRITRVTAPTANTCASNFSLGGFGKNNEQALELNNGNLTGETKQQLVLDYQTYDNILKQYKRLYTSLVDGGNTHGLMQTVENSFPAETWQLRQTLLGKSPYLSKKILEESSEKTTVLPEAIIYEILAANPDGLKDEELLKHLSEKINPLPAWMIELLREGSSQITPRTFLEAAILNSKAQRDQIISYLVHDIISKRGENEEMNHEELRSWLAAYQTPHGDYQIVDDYFETGNYSAGLAILSTIPSIYKLNQTELLEYNGLQSLFNVLAGVKASKRNIFLLNGSERNTVQDLADNGEGIAKVRACNLLGFVYGTECDYDKVFPQEKQYFKTEKIPAGKDNPLLPSINVFPNPAKDYVEFGYNLPSGALEGTLSITDIKGVVVHRQQLSTKYGQIAIDTREWQQGTYLYALTANGKSVFNQKFVLIK